MDHIPPARLQHLPSPSPSALVHPQRQIPPAHAAVTSTVASSAEPNPTDQIVPARGLQHLPSPRRHLHPCRLRQAKSHRQRYRCASVVKIPEARGLQPPVTSALAASAETNPTPRRTNNRASISHRLCVPNPTGARPPAPPVTSAVVASAEANPTGARRRQLHPCRLRQAKPRRRTDDPGSFSLLSWSQIPPARTDRASVSLRLCGPNPTGTQPPAPPVTLALVASAEAPRHARA